MAGNLSAHSPERPRVLVIDDEIEIREALDMFLSSEGYDVATAESGDAAVERAKEQVFELAITDLRMPGMNGAETVAALKRLNPDLAVIVVTGYASDESAIRCRAEGAFKIIRKPFQLDDLLLVVKAALRRVSA